METMKLLIVDDVEDNRLVLRAICRKLEGFEIFEAVDGQDAVEKCDALRPHIVLMDVMMPRLDGFQAAKIIKERYPDTVVMAVTAVIDPKMEANMEAIGVAAYIRKPIDKELIRLKLQSYAGALSIGGREQKMLMHSAAINPFSNEIRNFKTIFEIHNVESIMDLGVWLLVRFECAHTRVCTNIDMVLELLYELLHQEIKGGAISTITIEESFDEVFIHTSLPKKTQRNQEMDNLLHRLGDSCLLNETMVAFRLDIAEKTVGIECNRVVPAAVPVAQACPITPEKPKGTKGEVVQEMRSMGAVEHQVLRESFSVKTSAKEYVATLDGDAFGEVSELRDADSQWTSYLNLLADEPTAEHFKGFSNEILGVYSNAISALFEFSGLAYAIISLSTLIKSNTEILVCDEAKRSSVLAFLGYFKNDLSNWIEHVFELQDTQDIHYLDGSFFSSCMQIESIITGSEVDLGDEGEIEFF